MGLPRKIKNFATFVDGISYLGEMPEVAMPKLARKMDDYRSGGMNAPVKADFGMEGMEAELTAAGYMKDLFTKWGALRHDLVAGLGTPAWLALAAQRVRAPLATFAGR